MNGEITLYNSINAESSVTNLLSTVKSLKALAIGIVEPTSWGIKNSTLSIYNASGFDYRAKGTIVELTCNCRANTENKSKEIAVALVTALNRTSIGSNGQYYCQQLGVIPPQDENDAYNLPVIVTIKSGEELE